MKTLLVVLFALIAGTPARAAWPDSYPRRVALLEALRHDMAWPGMQEDPATVAERYQAACELGSRYACQYTKWQGEDGGDLQLALAQVGKR